jgi:hypothetical protein
MSMMALRDAGVLVSLTAAAVVAGGCTSAPPRTTPPVDVVTAPGVAPTNGAPPLRVTAPAPKASPCSPPGPGRVSDDDAPALQGGGADVELLAGLGARGVAKSAALRWLAGRYGLGADLPLAEAVFATLPCRALPVGDAAESALLCEVAAPTSITQRHAVILVVRSKRPVAVLDVGLGLLALDEPEHRHVDLALRVAPDGRSVELRDRAPEGTTLVEAPSLCAAREAKLDACETRFATEPTPESFAHPGYGPGSELIDPFENCMLMRGKDGRLHVARGPETMPPLVGLPAVLHDCAGGREAIVAMTRELSAAPPPIRAEGRQALAFFDKSCAQRGVWTWRADRFVKER